MTYPMTNSQIAEAKKLLGRADQATQVSQMLKLRRAHELLWAGNSAEIRDMARNGQVVFSGTLSECRAKAAHMGLM